jgi:REP element-mobilizing transposase RayT
LGPRIWQRGYYEHVIRGEEELARIRSYIEENPARWEEDEYFEGDP